MTANTRNPAIHRTINGEDRIYRIDSRWQLPEVGRGGGAIFRIIGTFKGAATQLLLWDEKMKRGDALWFDVAHLDRARRVFQEGGK